MAKQPILTDIVNILTSATALNANWDAIQASFNNTLSLDGSTPNSMGADIDLNNNDLLNIKDTHTSNLYLNGLKVVSSVVSAQVVDLTFGTYTDLSNSIDVKTGNLVAVTSGYNRQIEYFNIVAAGTYSAFNVPANAPDGVLVRNLTASGLQAVSLRTEYASFAEAKADVRVFTSGYWSMAFGAGGQYVTTGDNWGQTTAGGSKLLVEWGDVRAWGTVGDGVADDTVAIQKAVTAFCGAFRTLRFPAGGYRISSAITFPNTSFSIVGDGPTETYIQPLATATTINCFDFTGCNGPAKVIRDVSFKGPATFVYGSGSAINCSGTNGLYLDNVWMRGIYSGIKTATSSFICLSFCTFESCYVAANITDTLDESVWIGTTFYQNDSDINVAGAQATFSINKTTAIATRTNVLLITGSGLNVDGLFCKDNGSGNTPNIVNITGANNVISNVSSSSFGARLVYVQGALATGNRLSGLNASGVPIGVEIVSGAGNSIRNLSVSGATTYAIRVNTANNNKFFDFDLKSCAIGVSFVANDLTEFKDGKISGSTTADWHQDVANTGRLLIDNVESNESGLSGVEYIMTRMPSGHYFISKPSIPTAAYPFTVGDYCKNNAPAVGSPKGWYCTVSGSPGTWVSEGNL